MTASIPHTAALQVENLYKSFAGIAVLKGSAVVSVITLFDVMGQTRRIFSQTFDLSVYLWAALLYLLMTSAFVWLWRCLERCLTRHQRVRQAPSTATASAAKRVSAGVSP
jgi:ABC-type arginine/histidine transport system permease subunit